MTRIALLIRALTQSPGALARDTRGVSAVEFALLLPLMIALYLGAVELSQGIAADRKVTLTTRTIADPTTPA
jgi:Flp pilus assembly protein TadG